MRGPQLDATSQVRGYRIDDVPHLPDLMAVTPISSVATCVLAE
jgi:hypothetical protein